MSNHSLYLRREILRVEMLGHAPKFSSPVNTHKSRAVVTVVDDEFSLHLLQPFIILIVTHWKGWDAVNCLNQSAPTQSGFEKY
eukprot:scaffold57172_cov34-Cyclotella_meneghiniana.AAC.1